MEKRRDENEIKSKRKYLWSYQTHVRRIERLEEELIELRDMKISPSGKPSDGMPHGSSQETDLSGYAAEKDELERELEEEKKKRVESYKEIMGSIKKLKREKEKDVLFWKYIKAKSDWETAKKIGYSERQMYRIERKALENLQIPESCQ